METVKANYNCSQATLYVVLFLLAQNMRKHKVKLNSYKNKYSDTFISDFEALAASAQNLPTEQARSMEHEDLRVDLVALNKICRTKWQMMKGYIEEAFPEDKWKMNMDAAGWDHYEKASEDNWDSTEEMMNMAVSYVTENATKLETDGFMNASFVTEITTAGENFSGKLQAFLMAQENARTGTQTKVKKSVEAYNAGAAICKDGTIVANMENDPDMASQFSFEALVELVSPKGASTLIADVTNSATEMPLVGAEMTITGSDKGSTSNDEGRIEVTQLPAKTISGKIKADGFPDYPFTATLTGGTTRIKVTMTPMFTGEMKVGSEQPEVGMKIEN